MPVAATPDALAERLQSVRDTASSLYKRMMRNIRYGQERKKTSWKKKQKEKNQQQQKKMKKSRSNGKDQQQPKNACLQSRRRFKPILRNVNKNGLTWLTKRYGQRLIYPPKEQPRHEVIMKAR